MSNDLKKVLLRFAVVVLNTPILSEERFKELWNKAVLRVAVDGGNNHIFDLGQIEAPDVITGDFDSIRCEVADHFQKLGVKSISTHDQDHTDFTKSLWEISKLGINLDQILVYVENTGRLDQILANIETLFKVTSTENLPPVTLVSSTTISWILPAGRNIIHVTKRPDVHCGLIPIGEPVSGVVTKGLKWDLDGSLPLAFGRLVSTSNAFQEEEVVVETPKKLLWTQGI